MTEKSLPFNKEKDLETVIRYLRRRFLIDRVFGKIEISSQNGKDFRTKEEITYTLSDLRKTENTNIT